MTATDKSPKTTVAPNYQEPPQTFHIALTGHRPKKLAGYDMSDPFYEKMRLWLTQVINSGLSRYEHLTLHSGMALGADTVWARAIIAARAAHPGRVAFVAEIPIMSQANRWPSSSQWVWDELVEQADVTRVYAQTYTPECLSARNRGMISAADLLLAVWDGNPGGGTAHAVTFAEKNDVETFVMSPDRIRAQPLS